MSDKMQVLFVKQTGHVLAAFTRTADPEGKPEVSALSGGGLFVRNRTSFSPTPPEGETSVVLSGSFTSSEGETLVAPHGCLDVAVVDYNPDVFNDPRNFVAGGGKVAKLGPRSVELASEVDSIPAPPPTPASTHTPPLVQFSLTRVTVQLDGDPDDDKGVCVILQEAEPLPGDEPQRRIAQGVIKSGTHYISLDLKTSPDGAVASIPKKVFFILALIAGYQPLFGKRLPHQ